MHSCPYSSHYGCKMIFCRFVYCRLRNFCSQMLKLDLSQRGSRTFWLHHCVCCNFVPGGKWQAWIFVLWKKKYTKKCPFYRLVGGCFRRNSDTIFIFFADWNILRLLFFSYAKAAERELHLATDSKLAWCSRNMAVAPCCTSGSKHGTISPVSEAFPSSSSCKWAPACSSCFKGTWTQQLLQSSLLCSWQEKQVCRDRISHAACEVWTGIWPFAEDVWTSLGSGYEHSLFTLCR